MLSNIYKYKILMPNEIHTSCFLNGVKKFSKSSEYGIFLYNLNKQLISPLRLYLIHINNTHDDALFDKEHFKVYVKNIYINQIINTFQRIYNLIKKDGIIIFDTKPNYIIELIITNHINGYHEFLNKIKDVGTYIQLNKLWEEKDVIKKSILAAKLYNIYQILTIFTPTLSQIITKYFNFNAGYLKIKKRLPKKGIINYLALIDLIDDEIN
jgi:methionyl-tRNA synthetase